MSLDSSLLTIYSYNKCRATFTYSTRQPAVTLRLLIVNGHIRFDPNGVDGGESTMCALFHETKTHIGV